MVLGGEEVLNSSPRKIDNAMTDFAQREPKSRSSNSHISLSIDNACVMCLFLFLL